MNSCCGSSVSSPSAWWSSSSEDDEDEGGVVETRFDLCDLDFFGLTGSRMAVELPSSS